MIVRLKASQMIIENKFMNHQYFNENNLGWIELKKKDKYWKIRFSRQMGRTPYWKWNCQIKDQEIIINRKISFDQIIMFIFLKIPVIIVALILFLGNLFELSEGDYSKDLFIGTIICAFFCLFFWGFYDLVYHWKEDKVLTQILEKILDEPINLEKDKA